MVLVALKEGGSPPPLDERCASSLLATARALAGSEKSSPKALEVSSRLTACVASSTYGNNLPLILSEPLSTPPAITVPTAVSSTEVKVDLLPARVAASWGEHKGSIRRDNVNLEKVLELLEDVKDDASLGSDVAVTSVAARGDLMPKATVKEVLQMIANIALQSVASGNLPQMASVRVNK